MAGPIQDHARARSTGGDGDGRKAVMTPRTRLIVAAVCVSLAVIAAWGVLGRHSPAEREPVEIRRALFDAIQPVTLSNCTLERFGEAHDGGYLACGNLLDAVQAGYSYGINGYDGWGCALSARLGIPVHEYDCFNTSEPPCSAGDPRFHAECVGPKAETRDGRRFDSITAQVNRNGDTGRRLVMKVDVEGAEWDAFLATPEATFANIDQLVVEFHRTHEERFLHTLKKLKRSFYVAHLHFNNHSCEAGLEPFPAWAYEVLFVNKRIGVPDPGGRPAAGVDPLDTPNNAHVPDCQAARPR